LPQTNFDQLWWAPDAFGLIWKKEETLVLIREENGSEDLVKLRISNRPLSADSGTLLRNRVAPVELVYWLLAVFSGNEGR
jgi:hypothetical protein